MAEARKQLSRDELKGFKLSLEEFREKGADNADGKWTTMLDNEYMRSRVSRLEALKYQMRGEVELLKNKSKRINFQHHLKRHTVIHIIQQINILPIRLIMLLIFCKVRP